MTVTRHSAVLAADDDCSRRHGGPCTYLRNINSLAPRTRSCPVMACACTAFCCCCPRALLPCVTRISGLWAMQLSCSGGMISAPGPRDGERLRRAGSRAPAIAWAWRCTSRLGSLKVRAGRCGCTCSFLDSEPTWSTTHMPWFPLGLATTRGARARLASRMRRVRHRSECALCVLTEGCDPQPLDALCMCTAGRSQCPL